MTDVQSPILSFIVPVYNVSPYLRKCVDSLLAQDYDGYEIILVDDGSTDESGAICDEFASQSPITNHQSPIIRVLHQENRGLSAARNTGIAAAKGKYICFVDSDDFWQPNVLGVLITQMELEQLDVLRFDYQNVNEYYEVFEPNKTSRYIDKCTDIVDGQTYLNTRMGYACYAWQFIIRRDLIYNPFTHSFIHSFTEGIHFEDVDWLPRMMIYAHRVNSTTMIVYNYFMRQGSITKTQGNMDKVRKNIEDSLQIIEKYQSYHKLFPQCGWLHRMQSSMVVCVLTSVACDFYSERYAYIHRLRDLNAFPLAIGNQGRTFARRAHIITMCGPCFYVMMMYLYRRVLCI